MPSPGARFYPFPVPGPAPGAPSGVSDVAPLMPLVEVVEPEESTAAVAYLASEEARYVNGATLNIDGAQTAG